VHLFSVATSLTDSISQGEPLALRCFNDNKLAKRSVLSCNKRNLAKARKLRGSQLAGRRRAEEVELHANVGHVVLLCSREGTSALSRLGASFVASRESTVVKGLGTSFVASRESTDSCSREGTSAVSRFGPSFVSRSTAAKFKHPTSLCLASPRPLRLVFGPLVDEHLPKQLRPIGHLDETNSTGTRTRRLQLPELCFDTGT
jgi:hypothetical protein